MSIDARVVGLRFAGGNLKITLEDRPGGGPAGQQTLVVLNQDELGEHWAINLSSLIGHDIWGSSGEVMLRDRKFAIREGYTGVRLVKDWKDVLLEAVAFIGKVDNAHGDNSQEDKEEN